MKAPDTFSLHVGVLSRDARVTSAVARHLADHTARIVAFRTVTALRRYLTLSRLELVVVDDASVALNVRRIASAPGARAVAQVVFVNARSELRCAAILRDGADEAITARSPTLPLRLALAARRAADAALAQEVVLGDLRVDRARRRAWCANEEVHLTANEWHVLLCLVAHAPRPVTIEALAGYVWSDEEPEKAYSRIQVYICYLRQKLARSEGIAVRNVRGIGYQLTVGGPDQLLEEDLASA